METVVVAKALIVDADGNMLVLRRSKSHPHYALKADLPGGIVKDDEDVRAAVCREIQEETGLTLAADDLRLRYAFTVAQRNRNRVRHLFVVHLPASKPRITVSWEHDSAEWVLVHDVPEKLKDTTYEEGARYLIDNQLI